MECHQHRIYWEDSLLGFGHLQLTTFQLSHDRFDKLSWLMSRNGTNSLLRVVQ